jgi:hypothetical protein
VGRRHAAGDAIWKGLFRRHADFRGQPEMALFDLPCADDPNISCMFDSFPRAQRSVPGSKTRNVFKASFHDIIRSAIWKIDLGTGAIVGKIDIDEGSQATDIVFSNDGTTAYVVDQMFHSFHVFNTKRGQDGNPGTLFSGQSKFGPFGIEPDKGCISDALGSIGPESPHRLPPQVQIVAISSGDPIRATKGLPSVGTKVETIDSDTRLSQAASRRCATCRTRSPRRPSASGLRGHAAWSAYAEPPGRYRAVSAKERIARTTTDHRFSFVARS